MHYVKRSTTYTNFRLLISGLSNNGKTTSLATFIEDGKSTVIISCPGEIGARSLPMDTDTITSYYPQVDTSTTYTSDFSNQALDAFFALNTEVCKNKPDFLFWDGLHWLYNHLLNRASGGEFLSGLDMDKENGRTIQYRASRFYNRARHNFGQVIADMYTSSIPFFGATVWEKWEEVTNASDRTNVNNVRYLWPDISGEMATKVVGMFDGRVSARLEDRCLDLDCSDSAIATTNREKGVRGRPHYVWQFLPGGDVRGVGIKGLKVNKAMLSTPYIHQDYQQLKMFIDAFS